MVPPRALTRSDIPTIPTPVEGADRIGRPLSVTSTSTSSSLQRTDTVTSEALEWASTLLRDSWTIR